MAGAAINKAKAITKARSMPGPLSLDDYSDGYFIEEA
jgi:hypothetical protein